MGVEGDVVGEFTEFWVVEDGDVGVDRNDGTRVTCSGQERLGGGDVFTDLSSGSFAVVDKLVTDGDGENVTPRTVGGDGAGQGLDTGRKLVDVVDTEEQLLAASLCLQDVFDLATVDTVQSDQGVVGQLSQVGLDGGQILTGTIAVVRRVGDTLGSSREATGGAVGGAVGGGSGAGSNSGSSTVADGTGGSGGNRSCGSGICSRCGGCSSNWRVTADGDGDGLVDNVSLVHVVQVVERRGDS